MRLFRKQAHVLFDLAAWPTSLAPAACPMNSTTSSLSTRTEFTRASPSEGTGESGEIKREEEEEEDKLLSSCRYPGTTYMDHVMRYQADPSVKMIVVLGEVRMP